MTLQSAYHSQLSWRLEGDRLGSALSETSKIRKSEGEVGGSPHVQLIRAGPARKGPRITGLGRVKCPSLYTWTKQHVEPSGRED